MRTSRPRQARFRGFTLVELMVVVAIIGVLAGMAIFAMSPGDDSDSVRNYADEIAAALDSARQRSIASGTWQRVQVLEDQINTWQSTTEGMVAPTAWEAVPVQRLYPKHRDKVYQVSAAVYTTAGTAVSDGTGVPATIDFKPDGTAAATTIFIGDKGERHKARVLVYAVTGSVHTYDQW